MGMFDFFKSKKNKATEWVSSTSFNELIQDSKYVPLNKHPDVLIAVDRVADLVSNMTIQLWENTDEGDVRIRDNLARKIDIEPCEYMTRKSWMYKIVRDLFLEGKGNSIVHVEYDLDNNLIKNLTPLPMTNVTYVMNSERYAIKLGDLTYQSDEVIHFVLNPNPNRPWQGTGYALALSDIVQNLVVATETKRHFMGNKSMPSLIIQVDADTEELSTPEGREKIIKKYTSTTKNGDPWLLPANLMTVNTVKPLTLNDIAINESVEIDKKTVAGMLGVPPFFLGVGEFNKDEYNNFINTRVMSIATIIAQTLTRDLLFSPTRYFKLNPRSLYAYDLNELVSAGGQMVQLNAMRRNELRDWIGLAPDSEMNELIVLENYLPQEALGNQKKLKGE